MSSENISWSSIIVLTRHFIGIIVVSYSKIDKKIPSEMQAVEAENKICEGWELRIESK